MSAELVGILSVGATLVVGGLATAGALVGLMLRLDGRQSARMDRMDGRMDTFEARQYEIVQTVARLDATQQAMLATLTRIEEQTRPAGDPPARPTPLETGAEPADHPRQSVTSSTPTPA
jgi:hypothetical protein